MSSTNKIDIMGLKNGAVGVEFDRAVDKIMRNIFDANTDRTKKRRLQINIDFVPDAELRTVHVDVSMKKTLGEPQPVGASLIMGKDMQGRIKTRELKSTVPGQEYIDPDTGELRHDDGTLVDDDQDGAPINLNNYKKAKGDN